MPADEKMLTAKLADELMTRLDAVAERLDRSRTWVVREALAEWIGEEEGRHRMTLDALDEVDAGTTLSQAEVEGWAADRAKKRRKKKVGA